MKSNVVPNVAVVLAFIAMLHAALYNVGVELSHIQHESPAEASQHEGHHGHHGQHGDASAPQDDLASCFFCLDGAAGTGANSAPLFQTTYEIILVDSQTLEPALPVSHYLFRQPRAPPVLLLI